MSKTKIEWCDWTWNCVFGCLNGCPYCYASGISKRFAKQFEKNWNIPAEKFEKFEPVWIEKNFQKPIPKNAKHIFVNSMSDIMYWEHEWFDKLIKKTYTYPDKKFLFLTKSRDMSRLRPDNWFLGKTITTQKSLKESATLGVDFLSIEPIQENINLKADYFMKLKQIIVGAETGNRKGKVIPKTEWIEEIREFCQKNGIKLFEKDSLKDIVKRPLIQERI